MEQVEESTEVPSVDNLLASSKLLEFPNFSAISPDAIEVFVAA